VFKTEGKNRANYAKREGKRGKKGGATIITDGREEGKKKNW